MIFFLLFVAALALTCCITVRYGGRDEQLGATALVMAAALTPLVKQSDFQSLEAGIGIVDLALLVALIAIAIYSRKFWPIWAAGFQLAAIMVHVAALAVEVVPRAYADALAIFSYPVMAALALGTLVERRTVLRAQRSGPMP